MHCNILVRRGRGMTEVKIFAIFSHFLGEFTANFKDTYSLYSLAYSPMCEGSIKVMLLSHIGEYASEYVSLKFAVNSSNSLHSQLSLKFRRPFLNWPLFVSRWRMTCELSTLTSTRRVLQILSECQMFSFVSTFASIFAYVWEQH